MGIVVGDEFGNEIAVASGSGCLVGSEWILTVTVRLPSLHNFSSLRKSHIIFGQKNKSISVTIF